ncbi:MAG: flippase-like domain-containing protein [Pseudomonadales bacterium]|nr:flippase-like domain-containing protein [Pseudomonadales bacterium]
MTETPPQTANSARIRRALLLLITLACLGLVAVTLLERAGQFDISSVVNSPWLIHAAALQGIAIYLFILAWHLLLGTQKKHGFKLSESAAHIGVTLLGKYIPGKIWGLLGRAYLMTTREVTAETAAQLLLLDQFLTFYTGLTVGAIALVSVIQLELGLLALFVAAIISPVVARFNVTVITWMMNSLGNLISKWRYTLNLRKDAITELALMKAMGVYFIHWIAIGIVLFLLYYPALETQPTINCLLIVAAIPLAMLSGFVALWAPGGIGVREAVIVAILSLNLNLELALSIAITYRFICVLNDLLTGTFALYYYNKHPALLANA